VSINQPVYFSTTDDDFNLFSGNKSAFKVCNNTSETASWSGQAAPNSQYIFAFTP